MRERIYGDVISGIFVKKLLTLSEEKVPVDLNNKVIMSSYDTIVQSVNDLI